jgi:thioredoxin reductase (NADPH)
VAVVGETEEALSEAYSLSKHAKEVFLLIPGTKLKGDANIADVENVSNIRIYWKHRLKEILGKEKMEGILVQDDKKETASWHVDEALRTSVDGVFAGGDARRTPIKQAVISAADGAIASMGADQYINKRGKMRPQYS